MDISYTLFPGSDGAAVIVLTVFLVLFIVALIGAAIAIITLVLMVREMRSEDHSKLVNNNPCNIVIVS